jgi:hypothetical protein
MLRGAPSRSLVYARAREQSATGMADQLDLPDIFV